MAKLAVGFFAQALKKQMHMTIILPDRVEQQGPYPVLYLLHGISDDETIWTRRTSVERYVAGMPLIVVMPDGGRGFYTDARLGPACESHIMEDVIGFVDRFLPTIPERRGRAVEGNSMGGYGAMKLALKHPDRFCSVVAHSSVFDVRRLLDREERHEGLALIFGEDPAEGDNDVYRLAEKIDRGVLPAIRFDCGFEDRLIEHNRAFHEHLVGLGIEHQYEEFAGGHNWGYWDERVQEALRFHAAALGI